jgi:hypothetical protein
MKSFPSSLCAIVTLATAALFADRAQGVMTVTTLADEIDTPAGAQVSLREALRDSADGEQITFDAALAGKMLVLTAGEMTVSGKTLTITAPGGLIIEASGRSRIFNVGLGAALNLAGVTMQGGLAPDHGGAILSAGSLALTDCVLRDNRGAAGPDGAHGADSAQSAGGPGEAGGNGGHGGAVSSSGSLTALRCHFISNAAGRGGRGGSGGGGGGGYAGGRGGNGGVGGGGGAVLSTGTLRLAECTFVDNFSGSGGSGGFLGMPRDPRINSDGGDSGDGAGVNQTGDLIVERCTFARNAAPSGGLIASPGGDTDRFGKAGSGAAIFWRTGTAILTNCTLTDNSTGDGGITGEHGGAVNAPGGAQLRLVHCTIAGNSAESAFSSTQHRRYPSAAAGIVSATPVQCQNCIISGNVKFSYLFEPVESNFSQNTVPSVVPAGALGGDPLDDPQLGQLSETSSALPFQLPATTAPAVNAGALIDNPPATDRRGLPRAVGAPDLGAVEVQASEPPVRKSQSISFAASSQSASVFFLSGTADSGLPVSLSVLSDPATFSDGTLTSLDPAARL